MALSDTHLTAAAAESRYTSDELEATDHNLERVLQSRLPEHFMHSRLRGGPNYWVLEQRQGQDKGVWLAFNKYELREEMREADQDYDADRLYAVAGAYLDQFQSMGLTLAVPGPIGRKFEDPFFYPVHVSYPEHWLNSEWHTFQRFEELVGEYGLSPAEALDYWVTTRTNKDSIDWSGARGVQPEAIRKNIRQAKAQIEDNDGEPRRERNRIRAINVDELPQGDPHDPDEDMFYVPTEESLPDSTA